VERIIEALRREETLAVGELERIRAALGHLNGSMDGTNDTRKVGAQNVTCLLNLSSSRYVYSCAQHHRAHHPDLDMVSTRHTS
jgi:hypothetical protein